MSGTFWVLVYIAACVVLAVLLRYLIVLRLLLGHFREPIDPSAPACDKLREEDLDDGDLQFLHLRADELHRLGLEYLTDAARTEGQLKYLMTFWSVPNTRLIVLESQIVLRNRKGSAPIPVCEVYVRRGDANPLNVTSSQMFLPDHSGIIRECGMHVRPEGTEVPGLIATAWGLALERGINLEDRKFSGSIIDDLNFKRAQSIQRSLERGKLIRANDGTLRWSLRERLFNLVLATPGIPSATRFVRKRRFRREFNAIRHLLPQDYDLPEIIPAVQDRVRTGSTAPLSLP